MKLVDMNGGQRINEIADVLFSRQFSKIIQFKTLKAQDKTGYIEEAIRYLETKAKIYVERWPVVQGEKLRTDLHLSDKIYFATYPTITRHTLLYKTEVEYGDFTINHVLGCSHGCQYPCYAMQMSKRYGRVADSDDWMHPRVVGNALELLEKEIQKYEGQIQFVHLSFMTDPFMYDPVNERTFPWVQRLTLRIIERLNRSNIKATILTKGKYPEELTEGQFSRDNEYGITLVSMRKGFHDIYEPYSPSPIHRLTGLRRLHEKGLKTWVSIEPYPTPNIIEQDLGDLLKKVDFVDKMIFGKWNYNPDVNGYEDTKRFYTESADQVIEFCGANGISLHIKEKTPRSSSASEHLFK